MEVYSMAVSPATRRAVPRYREERFDDRSMVASAREIEAEERRSARMARAEDEKEEEEERRRAEAKAAKKRKRPGAFLDD